MNAFALGCLLLVAGVAPVARAQVPAPADSAGWVRTVSGLAYRIVAAGTGPAAAAGDTVRIHETLTLADGKLIFSTRDKNQPVTFTLGARHVIPGVDEGVRGMRVGERRTLLVPPKLDGRTFDPSFIPPAAIRHYDIELVAIVSKAR